MFVNRVVKILVLPLLASFSLGACQPATEDESENLRPVRYEKLRYAEQFKERSFAGLTYAAIEARLSFRVPGKVERVMVRMGDEVEAGQILAVLDDADLQLQLQQVIAQEKEAQAQTRNAQAHYSRVRALYVKKNASLAELDAARSQTESAEAHLFAVQQAVELARTQVNYTVLTASEAGTVAVVTMEEGELVGLGQIVLVIASANDLEAHMMCPESLIAQISTGDTVSVVLDNYPSQRALGVIWEIGVMSSNRTFQLAGVADGLGLATTYPVKVKILERNSKWRPGMALKVTSQLPTGIGSQRIFTPASSVGEDKDGRFVFVLEKTGDGIGVVQKRTVQTGSFLDEGIEVVEGLDLGDLIVTAGVSRVRDGDKVKIIE